ncbi:MAG: phage major tail protein, TP901-1 family [Rhizobiaceae bacterium]|nr:phage major tail protein, TP901-1 family [Rhizobiaceae bacterium]
MAAQKGKDLLLKVQNADKSAFITVAGMRSRRIVFNADTVDITDFESTGRWRQLLSGAGVQRASVSGAGLFKDADSDKQLRQLFFDGTIVDWEITIPDLGAIRGQFQITALEYGGAHDGEVTFDAALESAGPLTFTEAV